MKRVIVMVFVGVALAGCTRAPEALEIPAGSDVALEKRDGVTVSGRLIEVRTAELVVEQPDGQTMRVSRADIKAVRVATSPAAAADSAPPSRPATKPSASNTARKADVRVGERAPDRPAAVPVYRELTVPAGTTLSIELASGVSSETNKVEDPVRGVILRAVKIDGLEAIPAGATVLGTVTEATRSGRVKGRARVAFRFTSLELPEDAERLSIRTAAYTREAAGTKKTDAAKIGGAAAGGAIVGGILGGGDGAAKGAAVGGAAGTGVVLSTRGDEVSVASGSTVAVKLTGPLTLRVRTS